MFLPLMRGMLRLITMCVVVTVSWAGLVRGAQNPMPPLLYSENFTLFRLQVGCASLLNACKLEGEHILDTLYSLPVSVAAPDGKQVAVHLYDQWGIFEATCLFQGQDCIPRLLDPAVEDTRLAWGPDGSVIAYMDNNGTTMHLLTRGCWEPETGRCLKQQFKMSDKNRIGQISWSSNGEQMIFADGQSTHFAVFDLKCLDDEVGCSDSYQFIKGNFPAIMLPTLSADGTEALYNADTSLVGLREQLFILNIETGEARQITHRSGASLHPTWSADGRYIAYVGFDKPESGDLELFVMDLQRGLTMRLLHHELSNIDYPMWGVPAK